MLRITFEMQNEQHFLLIDGLIKPQLRPEFLLKLGCMSCKIKQCTRGRYLLNYIFRYIFPHKLINHMSGGDEEFDMPFNLCKRFVEGGNANH